MQAPVESQSVAPQMVSLVEQAAVQHLPEPWAPQTLEVHWVLPVQGAPAARPPVVPPLVVPPVVPPVVVPPVVPPVVPAVVPPEVPEVVPVDESPQALARMKPNPANSAS
jgi:hypothetical protein